MRKATRAAAAAAIIMAAFLFFGFNANAKSVKTTTAAQVEMNELERATFDYINYLRVENGLKPLAVKEALITDARVRALESAKFFSHTRPDGTDWYSLDDANMYGECLAKGYSTAVDVCRAWMNSPTHKAVLLRSDVETGAIGGYIDANGVYYLTLEVGFAD